MQPGLTKVIRQTTGANSTAFVHGPAGLTRQQRPDGAWLTPLSDGLGSIRTLVDETTLLPVMSQHYASYGQPLDTQGGGTPYGFTGELTDADGLLYLRARYYNPALGIFSALDPLLGDISRPITVNRYGYAGDDPINEVDPTGYIFWRAANGITNELSYRNDRTAHSTIEYYLEQNFTDTPNEEFWQVMAEYEIRNPLYPLFNIARVDVITFDTLNINNNPLDLRGTGAIGRIYEIEPATRLRLALSGLFQLRFYRGLLNMGSAYQFGTVVDRLTNVGGRNQIITGTNDQFNWTDVNWQFGNELNSRDKDGPVYVNPRELNLVSQNVDGWWIMHVGNGLILYVSVRDLRRIFREFTNLTAAQLAYQYFMDVWQRLRDRGEDLPQPNPSDNVIPFPSRQVPVTPVERPEAAFQPECPKSENNESPNSLPLVPIIPIANPNTTPPPGSYNYPSTPNTYRGIPYGTTPVNAGLGGGAGTPLEWDQ